MRVPGRSEAKVNAKGKRERERGDVTHFHDGVRVTERPATSLTHLYFSFSEVVMVEDSRAPFPFPYLGLYIFFGFFDNDGISCCIYTSV